MNKLKLLNRYSAAITFLAFEFFALIAFSYSGSFVLFGSLSLALCVLLILFNIGEIKAKGLSNVALFFIPLFIFTLLTAVGNYNLFYVMNNNYKYFTWGETVFIILGLLPMAFNGYLLSIDRNFKLKTFIVVIFSALAVYVLINFVYNLINFGAFYPVFYKNFYLYYNGIKSEVAVNEMAYVLEGFKFIEVKMSHYVLYPLLLLSSSVMLLFTSPKKEKGYFFTFLAFTILAIFALTFIPSLLSLTGLGVIAVLVLIIYLGKTYVKTRKAFKIILIALVTLFLLGYLFYVIVVSTGISNSFTGFLKRLFVENRFSKLINPNLEGIFSSSKFLGFAGWEVNYWPYFELSYPTGFFIFDTFMTSGVIGALAIFIFIFLGFNSFKKYFHSHKDEFRLQATLLLFLIVFVGYSAFFNEVDYALYYRVVRPLYLTAPFSIMIFMFSYVICKSRADEVKVVEEKKEEVTNA
ncbi:MAG: hypothetical protein IJQ72_02845 [Bacilli bacterium]|nr:hypothetical protein [Bacilli bacterium]